MARIEDYALIGDMHTAALVNREGSIDWACFPRFDSDACFAALLGDEGNGRWRIAPAGANACTRRRYRDNTLVLETEWDTADGSVRLIDLMPLRGEAPDIVRIVEGLSGRVRVRSELLLRLGYGKVVPWIRELGDATVAVCGPDALWLRTPVPQAKEKGAATAEFEVAAGDRVPFVLTWKASHLPPPDPTDAEEALEEAHEFWLDWASCCSYRGPWRDDVIRSLITLKALIYAPTGGIIAATTTSLPEQLGGERNWDYRYCWLRDATFCLQALGSTGYIDEAVAWRDWLLRAIGGDANNLQIMYGLSGERRLAEDEIPWLAGYEESRPVRVGNAAVGQRQLDVYGEVIDAMFLARGHGLPFEEHAWDMQATLVEFLESAWREPDQSLWEVRSEPRHFVHSKVMAWVAFDRAVRTLEHAQIDGPLNKWRAIRDEIVNEVCDKGFDSERNTFTQSYGSQSLDAATLLIPHVGFLPPDDPRVVGTVDAVQRELCHDGFVLRYDTQASEDGVSGSEGAFLACTFWLADALALIGRRDEARALFERVLDIRNDLGLLAEEYDPIAKRQVGNFPQAFSHVPLVNTALSLHRNVHPRHPDASQRP